MERERACTHSLRETSIATLTSDVMFGSPYLCTVISIPTDGPLHRHLAGIHPLNRNCKYCLLFSPENVSHSSNPDRLPWAERGSRDDVQDN